MKKAYLFLLLAGVMFACTAPVQPEKQDEEPGTEQGQPSGNDTPGSGTIELSQDKMLFSAFGPRIPCRSASPRARCLPAVCPAAPCFQGFRPERRNSMQDYFSRSRLLLGEDAMDRLARARVAVFGLGGVGGYVCEALARSGVGHLELTDADRVAPSNLNRQIIATVDTVGRLKTEVMAERIRSISPGAEIVPHETFVLPENVNSFPFETYDYVVDAVDTVAAKLALIQRARDTGVRLISAMGAGNKLDPTRFRVGDLYETRMDPLARVLRRECRKRGIDHLKVVYSEEEPLSPLGEAAEEPVGPQDEAAGASHHRRRGRPRSDRSQPVTSAFYKMFDFCSELC